MSSKKITDDELRKATQEYRRATDEAGGARLKSKEAQKTLEDLMVRCNINAVVSGNEVTYKSPLYNNVMMTMRARRLD